MPSKLLFGALEFDVIWRCLRCSTFGRKVSGAVDLTMGRERLARLEIRAAFLLRTAAFIVRREATSNAIVRFKVFECRYPEELR